MPKERLDDERDEEKSVADQNVLAAHGNEEPNNHVHRGLSAAGRTILKEKNCLWRIVDVSHTGIETQLDTLMYFHILSNAYALFKYTQKVSDNLRWALQKDNSVLIVTLYSSLLENGAVHAALESVAAHIQYLSKTVGFPHIGMWSDFDGMAVGLQGLEDVGKYPSLAQEVQSQGITKDDILGITGLTWSRTSGIARRWPHPWLEIRFPKPMRSHFFGR